MKLGLIGAGWIGSSPSRLHATQSLELLVADPIEERAEALAADVKGTAVDPASRFGGHGVIIAGSTDTLAQELEELAEHD